MRRISARPGGGIVTTAVEEATLRDSPSLAWLLEPSARSSPSKITVTVTAMAMGPAITAADLIITVADHIMVGHIMAGATIIGLSKVGTGFPDKRESVCAKICSNKKISDKHDSTLLNHASYPGRTPGKVAGRRPG